MLLLLWLEQAYLSVGLMLKVEPRVCDSVVQPKDAGALLGTFEQRRLFLVLLLLNLSKELLLLLLRRGSGSTSTFE